LFALDYTCFGSCPISFATRCGGIPIPRNCELQLLYDLAHALHSGTRPSTADLTQFSGYLFLTVISHSRDGPFLFYIDRESKSLVSVIKGCYVTPFAPMLFTRNQHLIDDSLMDATWKIISFSVVASLMLSICNVGILVMLPIGLKEDKALCETFYAIRQDHFNINLNGYRAVSNQGTALRTVRTDHENQQFLCLRDFLVF
jgi:hypothetical protein